LGLDAQILERRAFVGRRRRKRWHTFRRKRRVLKCQKGVSPTRVDALFLIS